MVIGITGSKNIKEFNPILYLQFSDPNFKAFCIKNGFPECEVSEVVTGTSDGVEKSVKFWCDMLKYNLHILAPEAEEENSACFESFRKIADRSDVILLISDGISSCMDAAVNYCKEHHKPLYMVCEYHTGIQ
jgi:hypothetical protein